MTGIYLLVVAMGWLAFVAWLSVFSTKKLPLSTWRVPVALAIFAVALPLPLVDELVGKRQFEQLCAENSTVHVDRATAVGRTVYFVPQPNVEVKGTWVRIVLQPRRYIDATTGEVIVSYNELIASGGHLIRALGVSEGGMPLLFRGTCVPANRPASTKTFEPYGIRYIEPPATQNGGNK